MAMRKCKMHSVKERDASSAKKFDVHRKTEKIVCLCLATLSVRFH